MADSLQASEQGINKAKQALSKKGLSATSKVLVALASSFVREPDHKGRVILGNVSKSVIGRFWQREAIASQSFIAICQALDINWKEIAEISEFEKIINLFQKADDLYAKNQFEACCDILLDKILKSDEIVNLICSSVLWNHSERIMNICEKLTNYENALPVEKNCLVMVPLGFIYSDIGKNETAIKLSQKILDSLQNNMNKASKSNLSFVRFAAYLVISRAYRMMGNFRKSREYGQNALDFAKKSRKQDWIAIADFQLSLVDIDTGRIPKAASRIASASLLSIGLRPAIILNNLWRIGSNKDKPVEDLTGKMDDFFTSNKHVDYTKRFSIIYNFVRCLNSSVVYDTLEKNPPVISEKHSRFILFLLDHMDSFLPKEDHRNRSRLCLEYAAYYAKAKIIYGVDSTEIYYNKIMNLHYKNSPDICKALTLLRFGEWLQSQLRFADALDKYNKLNSLLEGLDFYHLQAETYFQLGLIYSGEDKKGRGSDYLRKAYKLFQTIGASEQSEKVKRKLADLAIQENDRS